MPRPIEDILGLTPEELNALAAAMKLLGKNHRLMFQIIPEKASAELCKRLTSWVNFVLDTGLLPPMVTIAQRSGDGLVCPYCGVGIKAHFPNKDILKHKEDCLWREAVKRWSLTQVQITKEHL